MPVFSRQLGTIDYNSADAVKILANHLRIMQEELEYRLMVLDSSNINEIALESTSLTIDNEDVAAIIREQGNSIAGLSIRANEIALAVSDQEGRLGSLQVSVDGINSTVIEIGESLSNYSTIDQTASSISIAVADLENRLATTLSVLDDGVYITQLQNKNYLKLTSQSIELYGTLAGLGAETQYLEIKAKYGSGYESGSNAGTGTNYWTSFSAGVGNAEMAFLTMLFSKTVTFGSNGKVYFKGAVDFSAAEITGSYLTFS